jgi:hypothetical protein
MMRSRHIGSCPAGDVGRQRTNAAHAGRWRELSKASYASRIKIVCRREASGTRSLQRVLSRSVALAIGAIAGVLVTLMSQFAQLAHVFIYGIPLDVHLSAHAYVDPIRTLLALGLAGLTLGLMEWSRRRWKISAAVDPIEANALRRGHISLRDSIVVSGQTLISTAPVHPSALKWAMRRSGPVPHHCLGAPSTFGATTSGLPSVATLHAPLPLRSVRL